MERKQKASLKDQLKQLQDLQASIVGSIHEQLDALQDEVRQLHTRVQKEIEFITSQYVSILDKEMWHKIETLSRKVPEVLDSKTDRSISINSKRVDKILSVLSSETYLVPSEIAERTGLAQFAVVNMMSYLRRQGSPLMKWRKCSRYRLKNAFEYALPDSSDK